MFNVYRIVPDYDFRDAVCGHRALVHPYAFHTEGGALAVARFLGHEDEVEVVVVPLGASPFDRKAQVRRFAPDNFDDIPF